MSKSEPLLDTEETSLHNSPTLTYRQFRISKFPEEYTASENLYNALDRRDGSKRLEQFEKCRTLAFFAWHEPTGNVRVSSNACRMRWCPICSKAKEKAIAFELEKYIRQLKSPKFLTLTQKHSNAPIDHQVKTLYDCFVKLRRSKLFKKNVRGGIWFFQIKKSSKDELWHPHIHCLIDSDYMWHNDLSKLWLSITMTSKIVDIRAVKTPEETSKYVARYAARPSSLSSLQEDEQLALFDALHGRRLCGSFGSAHGLHLTSPAKPDHSEYINLGSFETIRRLIDCDIHAREIWKAWQKGDPIACPHVVKSPDVVSFDRIEKPWLHFNYDDFKWE
jgi:hypothetical protein